MNYVILAGGLGSRLSKEGEPMPKPLIQLMGQPMIGRLVKVLSKFNAEQINIAANARMAQLLDYLEQLKSEGYPVEIRPIITDNSYCSLKEAARGLKGKFIGMTCDAIFTNREFGRFVEEFEALPEEVVLMGLTRFVDDESPLYAKIDPATEQVVDYRYGGEPFPEGTIISAGIYGLNEIAMNTIINEDKHPTSLSDFQRILAAETDLPVLPYDFEKAFDVDHVQDRLAAEEFLRKENGE